MEKIKLFENFNYSSFEDVDDLLYSLQDQGILKLKNKPSFLIETEEEEEGIGAPQIVIRYSITKDLGKIDSIQKLETLENLLRDFRQAMSRIGTFGDYLIDLAAKEWEVKLPVPDNIKKLTNLLGYPSDLDLSGGYFPYDNDIDGYPRDVKLKFTVDEDLNVIVEIKPDSKFYYIRKGNTRSYHKIDNMSTLVTDEKETALKKHFLDNYGLKFIGDEVRGKLKFYKFINN
jgi:hypothetical protein